MGRKDVINYNLPKETRVVPMLKVVGENLRGEFQLVVNCKLLTLVCPRDDVFKLFTLDYKYKTTIYFKHLVGFQKE
jgi:hypothetical protein